MDRIGFALKAPSPRLSHSHHRNCDVRIFSDFFLFVSQSVMIKFSHAVAMMCWVYEERAEKTEKKKGKKGEKREDRWYKRRHIFAI